MAADPFGEFVAGAAQGAGDDPCFAGQFLRGGGGALVVLAEIEAALAQGLDQLLVVLEAEKIVDLLGHHRTDILGALQLRDRGGRDSVQRVEFAGQLARHRGADVHDAEAEEQAPERLLFAAFDRGEQVGRALLAHAFESGDILRFERIDIGKRPDQTRGDQLIDHGFAQSLDIHRSARGEMPDAAADLGRAIRIEATDRGQFRIAEYFAPAGRAFLRHLEFLFLAGARLGVHSDHGRYHFARFFDKDPVAYADVFPRDFLLVVQGGAGHAAPGDRHRLEFGHRSEGSHAPDLHGDAVEFGPRPLRLVFEGHGPARRFRRAAGLLAALELVELDHRSVGFKGEVVPDLFQRGDGLAHAGFVTGFPEFRDDRKSGFFQPRQKSGLRRRGRAALDRAESVEDGVESAPRDDRRIEKFERTGGRVARVGEEGLAFFFAFCIQRGEFFLRQVNLAPDFEQLGDATFELERNGPDGADILRDVVAGCSVAARRGQL